MHDRFRNRDSTVLLLPGMTMNSTIMPDLGTTAISFDFNILVDDVTSSLSPGGSAMDTYVELLDSALEHEEMWRARPRIIVGHSFGGMLALARPHFHLVGKTPPRGLVGPGRHQALYEDVLAVR